MALQTTLSGPRLCSYFNGAFQEGEPSLVSVNPAKPEEVVADICATTAPAAVEAIEAAAEAAPAWANLPGPARAEHLYRWAEHIQKRADEMALAVAREVGKPIGEAKGEVGRCIAILRYFAGECVRESGQVIPAMTPGSLQFSIRAPLGVVGLITPWNFPVAIPLWKTAPALAFGNTVVMHPAQAASLCGALLAETAHAAGLPRGVFNVLLGQGSVLGGVILDHEKVKAVSLTGSNRVGAIVAERCARRNAKFQTEMGGKNVGIVLADADLKLAANLVAGGAMRFAGQKCTATSRVVVDQKVQDAFQAELIAAIDKLKVADPLEADCAVGPVISQESKASIEEAIGQAGAPVYSGATLPGGYYVAPTLYRDVDPASPLAQEELFGPVLAMITANDFDHAIELANGVRYGLSASLFTKDISSAIKYIGRIEAGLVRVNSDTTGVNPHAPFGGVKGSSSGSREQGPAAKEFYTEIKTVQINPG